jgi:transcriptional regulator with XRE-family HTH domain
MTKHPLLLFRESNSPKLSQAELAEMLGVDRSYVAKIENGLRPGVDLAMRIQSVTGIEWTSFFVEDTKLSDN